MANKTIIITGATDGIGLESATKIAALGNQVGLVGRNPDKGLKAINRIVSLTGNDKLDFFQSDLSLISEINKLSDCLLYTSPSPRDATLSRMPSSA